MNAATLAKRAVMAGVGLVIAGGISLGALALPAHADDGTVPLDTTDRRYDFLASESGRLGGMWNPDSWGTYNSLN